jgi:5,10-methylene-tetrahydrofolate dehydrogenase/methenyl tetrahydrofolate cyclohydrolase
VIRFSPSHSHSENFYYLTQVLSVVYFVESLDASSLTIDPEEFERGINTAKEALQNSKLLLEKPLLKLTKKEELLQNVEAAKDITTLIDSHWYY